MMQSSEDGPFLDHAVATKLQAWPAVSAIGVRRGSFAALLMPAGEAALKLMGEPCYVIGSNLAVRARRQGREVFVWKEKSVEATAESLHEFEKFASDVAELLAR